MNKNYLIILVLVLGLGAGCASPFHSAIEKNDISAVKNLLEHGADVNSVCYPPGVWDQKPLHAAAAFGSEEMVRLLLSRGANVNETNTFIGGYPYIPKNWTALHSAAYVGRPKMVELLLKNGADPLVQLGNEKKMMLVKGRSENADVANATPLMLAQLRDRQNVIPILEKAECNRMPERCLSIAQSYHNKRKNGTALEYYQIACARGNMDGCVGVENTGGTLDKSLQPKIAAYKEQKRIEAQERREEEQEREERSERRRERELASQREFNQMLIAGAQDLVNTMAQSSQNYNNTAARANMARRQSYNNAVSGGVNSNSSASTGEGAEANCANVWGTNLLCNTSIDASQCVKVVSAKTFEACSDGGLSLIINNVCTKSVVIEACTKDPKGATWNCGMELVSGGGTMQYGGCYAANKYSVIGCDPKGDTCHQNLPRR